MEGNSSALSMITIILLGKRGCDKALIGNTILGNECFSPETSTCKKGVRRLKNLMCCVINTPDLYHGPRPGSKEQALEELTPSFTETQVFLLIMQDHHVSSEEIAMFAELKETYGESAVGNTIVVLIGREGKAAQSEADPNIRRILGECDGRVCSFKPGMKPEELHVQLTTQYERMQQKRGAESLYETVDIPEKPSDEKSAKEKARHEATEEKSVAVVSDGGRNVMTIVLLGQTGSGKSATGNTILAKRHFESRASSTAITQECKAAEELVCGIKVRVVDTPDFFSEDLMSPEIHVQKCRELSQPEPVVYILVMHTGRFTEGEREIVSKVQKTFGEDVVEKTVILFTGKEKLRGDHLHDYIINTDPHLQQLIKKTGSRCHAFNNNDKSRHQVKELMGMIMEMLFTGEDHFREHFPGYKKIEHKNCRLL